MKLSDFTYEYPKSLIAKYPAEPRDTARLMVLDRKVRSIEHRTIGNLPEYFGKGDVLVINNTKVFPARLFGNKEKTGARIEVFLLRELNPESRLWDVIVDPARKIRIGNKLYFENGLVAEVIDNTTSRGRTIRFVFEGDNEALYAKIDEIGQHAAAALHQAEGGRGRPRALPDHLRPAPGGRRRADGRTPFHRRPHRADREKRGRVRAGDAPRRARHLPPRGGGGPDQAPDGLGELLHPA